MTATAASRRDAGRRAAALVALVALVAAVVLLRAGHASFPTHVAGHLLLAQVAPLALAWSAPVTLALRRSDPPRRRLLVRLLRSRPLGLVTAAPVLLALHVGGMYAFYLTGLFHLAHAHPWLNLLVHVHMFLAGYLLSWYLVGADPVPSRPSTTTRLLVLLIAAGSHDVLAKLMYARLLPLHAGPAEQVQLGAQVMYYGGDAVTVLLATAVMAKWYVSGRRTASADRSARLSPPP